MHPEPRLQGTELFKAVFESLLDKLMEGMIRKKGRSTQTPPHDVMNRETEGLLLRLFPQISQTVPCIPRAKLFGESR